MKRNGFTLIELMIVIAIIMILANVSYSIYEKYSSPSANNSQYPNSQSQYSDRKETR